MIITSDKKNICIVLGGHFSAQIGGAQFQAACIVEGLRESKRYNIYYLARATNPEYNPDGYEIVQIARHKGIRKYSLALDAPRLLTLLRTIKPDVIYQRCLNAYTGVVAYYGKKAGCQSVFHIASDFDLLPLDLKGKSRLQWLRSLEKRMGEYGLKNVDNVIAQTRSQAELLQRNYGRKATAVIPNFHPFPTEELVKRSDKVQVIWVANFKRVKQPEAFVRLAKTLSYRDDLRFVMIGRAGAIEKYAKLHAEIRQIPNLAYMGELPMEEVNRLIAESHILVNTSRAEGFPNTFIQAWMRKVPTLSLGVNPDGVLTSEQFGYCGNTFEALRDKVLELADNVPLRERMGIASQQHAFAVHTPESVHRLISIFDGIKVD